MEGISAAGMFGKIIGGFFPDKMAAALAEKFRAALEQGDTKQIAELLRQVKAMSPRGEKEFLRAVMRDLLPKAEGKKGAAAFRDMVLSKLSPEQRQALVQELYGGVHALKKAVKFDPANLEAALDKLLLGIGGSDVRFLPILRDGIDKLPSWARDRFDFLRPLRAASSGSVGEATALSAEARAVGNEPAEQPAEARAEADRIRAEMARNQR